MSQPCLDLEQKLLETVIPLGDYELKFEHKEFGSFFEEKARAEIRETPENVEQALKELKKLVTNEPQLEFPIENEDNLKIFLRPSKFYPDSAFKVLRQYYKFKVKHPQYYGNLLPSNEKAAFIQNLLTILPLRTSKGERVLVIEIGRKWNPKSCSVNEVVRAVILILEAALNEPRTQVSGAHVLLDMEGLSLNHVWQFTPSFAKDIVGWIQECVPIRLKGVHVVNQPYVFNMLFALFKPFLGEKLRSRIHFHGTNFTSLHEMIDKPILPLKYKGGANIPMDQGENLHRYLALFEPEFKVKLHEGYIDGKK